MNEQIKELYDTIADGDKLNFDSYLAEKFAELIVRECADIARRTDMNGIQIAYIIKEHFGVEE
jgi:hypothetical protein